MYVSVIVAFALIGLTIVPVIANASVSQELDEEQKKSGFYREDGWPKYNKDRPAINPDFAPDEDCNLAYELKCLPGTEQKCPEGYSGGDDNVCSPIKCQEGYHEVDDDESGLCYPNSEPCSDSYLITYDGKERFDYVFVEGENGKDDRCANPAYLCDNESSHEICKEYLDWSKNNLGLD